MLALEGKGVEWDGDNVEHMWEQVKRAIIESAREVKGRWGESKECVVEQRDKSWS